MLKKILNGILSLYTRLRYGKVPFLYSYFYRDTYYCQLIQWKYIIKDYIVKKPYKKLEFEGEFAPDLMFALPFAYWHHKNGTLLTTAGASYTNELYFFSKNHQERFPIRTTEGNYNFEMPRILYSQNYNMSKWEAVPLKEHYQNKIYLYEKPILIVANRYNMEWDGPPISFFSKEVLTFIFETLGEKYKIIYNRPRPQNITLDNSDIYDLDEYDWIENKYPDVILMENLFKENEARANNFNHLQLMVYANASHFLSIHGGTATLASYFGGVNLILSKKGPEHYFRCFQKLFPKLSGAKILHAKTDDEFKKYLDENF